ncbi:hypothetical protein [Helicobacter didelphidarum]|uniref:hypothetical protein n=1 Tax=Helicobacter didelphidarum TaxID=2040648 RepID=UPI0015F19798|nr:hypothetical protein [Helicobacter didelphidarum]
MAVQVTITCCECNKAHTTKSVGEKGKSSGSFTCGNCGKRIGYDIINGEVHTYLKR